MVTRIDQEDGGACPVRGSITFNKVIVVDPEEDLALGGEATWGGEFRMGIIITIVITFWVNE